MRQLYGVLVFIEDQGRGLPSVLKSTMDSIGMLMSTRHDDDEGEESRRWEDVVGEFAERQ